MSELPGDLLFTDEHEWLRREDDGGVTVGITDHAQASLGDLVYVELPEVDQAVDWKWSSARWYANGRTVGVPIQWNSSLPQHFR